VLKVVRIRNKEEFGSALIYGLPVYFGYSGHAIYAVDPIDRSRFRYANSWDESWGDGGFGTISYNSIVWSYTAYAILTVTTPTDEL
jgi:C1A family cysteine protease